MRLDQVALTILPSTKPKPRRGRKSKSPLHRWFGVVIAWLKANKLSRPSRRMKLVESVSLGEKRFAAVVKVDGREFLLGGSANSVCLLADLNTKSFASALLDQTAHNLEPK